MTDSHQLLVCFPTIDYTARRNPHVHTRASCRLLLIVHGGKDLDRPLDGAAHIEALLALLLGII